MFFKKNKNIKNDNNLSKVAALLIHAGKIDEDFSNEEEDIIKQAILKLGASQDNINRIIEEGKKIEENANQILDFTREVKSMNADDKIEIVETLWKIIYSNKKVDIYESNLMRRLAGLMYIDNKIMGDIKERVKNKNSQ